VFTVEREGALATPRHHHPPHGLVTAAALVELGRAVRRLERDDSVRVILLRGRIAHTELDEIERMSRGVSASGGRSGAPPRRSPEHGCQTSS
jgi:enoyl-CoA hydratase/carnithine racemase